MSPAEIRAREAIADAGRMLADRGLAHGTAGNISIRLDDGLLVTPTNSALGSLDPSRIAKIDFEGVHLGGDPPSKEGFMHIASYARRVQDAAVVHLHCAHSVAVSCLDGLDPQAPIPPITAYYAMKVGGLTLLPYFRPGDPALADAVAAVDPARHAILLANHGPIVSGKSLDAAVGAIEELEETARIFLLLGGRAVRALTPDQLADLAAAFPS
ncbi:L-fuculose phosphate aldolase [Tsuneonella dongtanensis]|uniref:3-oxo-tetronate 4-phosphate decarboxylase n=1 Tax=Tsuneonella dongtanensis TaxID=692370 RepID=A0A1B2AB62_9SPHN|nr:3-oxo-tetronate 4-phosphate decarboxylase [Tsuneonella dongtanensis]ANY19318.1 L-fuculose phosphate aldolase [Tsuneonella dongtanensis]